LNNDHRGKIYLFFHSFNKYLLSFHEDTYIATVSAEDNRGKTACLAGFDIAGE
jgi:hypothetical protein